MAKADETIADWVWLWEARESALRVFGTPKLAEQQLIEWLAAGKLPWTCMKWKGLDAKGIEELRRWLDTHIIYFTVLPSVACSPGDPYFWSVRSIKIDWHDNAARTPWGHAQALGIKVSDTHLQALLPGDEPSEHEEVGGAGRWIAAEALRMKKAGEIPDGIIKTKFAKKLEGRLEIAADADRSLRKVRWRYINNNLAKWGLWPISFIK